MLLYELTRGLAYLRIKHPSIDWYTVRLPVLASALLCAGFAALPVQPKLLGADALLGGLLSILATLPGFYFAGLAAIATFDRSGMDVEIPPPAPSLEVKLNGKIAVVPLTKRLFLSYLFSYLTTLSLAICGLILLLNALEPTLMIWAKHVSSFPWSGIVSDISKIGLFAIVIVPVTSLVFGTLHGIYFLAERVHQPN